jgi:hypothetical protein
VTIRSRETVRTCSVIAQDSCGSLPPSIRTWFGQPRSTVVTGTMIVSESTMSR